RPGLNVLTGETGAGKTMVVSALELLLGGRADADRVRAGAQAALVEGCLSTPPAAAAAWLGDADEELIVSREVSSSGAAGARSRVRIGGRMAPVSALVACVGAVVELHGQSDTSRLQRPSIQRGLLDRFGGESLRAAHDGYSAAYEQWVDAREELHRLRSSTRDRAREADRLRFELDEIAAVDPQAGEDQSLEEDMGRLEHAETLATAAQAAASAVTDDGGARDVLATAEAALRGAAGLDHRLDALSERLASALAEVQDAGLELHGYAADTESDPAALEALRDRRADLVRLSRKYGETAIGGIDTRGVLAYADRARAKLLTLDEGDERQEALEHQVSQFDQTLRTQAGRLHDERAGAGKRLTEIVEQHLAELAMPGAQLEVAVEPSDPAPHGADRVTFMLSANPGEAPLPIGKAASGGERSRIALALRLALADVDQTQVLVFDEVDAGIGGATAKAVGRKLAGLARGRQVLCVTHLAQLAAHADVHFRVEKRDTAGRTVAEVALVEESERVEELSRMLAGDPDSEIAVDHAAELLANARRGARGP
ncbi:MAG: DNA repair protein RecN, partial [Nitriliruptorales bacterium]|nr:DNA repair protein RecN [Nitriliruptorales bacterium]